MTVEVKRKAMKSSRQSRSVQEREDKGPFWSDIEVILPRSLEDGSSVFSFSDRFISLQVKIYKIC
jgi:hypothetical protein